MWSTEDINQEISEFSQKIAAGAKALQEIDALEFAPSAAEVIYSKKKLKLYRYISKSKSSSKIPVLIVFSLTNRPYILDLSPKCSLIKKLLNSGLDVYLLDWGYPDANDCQLSLEEYITDYLHNCVKIICKRYTSSSINLFGVCQGGVFSLCYSSLYPKYIKNLITIVTPVDFSTQDNLIHHLLLNIDIDALVKKMGNIPGGWLTQAFISLNPYRLLGKKYLGFLDQIKDVKSTKKFLAVEKWIYDVPDQAGETFRSFIKDFYQKNKLIKGVIKLKNRNVKLDRLTMPILNIIANNDHIVPPDACLALKNYIVNPDYTEKIFPGGHIGIFISQKTQSELSKTIAIWLKQRR